MDLPPPSFGRARVRHEFAAFYRGEVRFAWRVLLRLGVGAHECEDALQDVFITAHQRWHSVREPDRRHAWLAGIIRRIAWRYRRTNDRRTRRLEALAAHITAPPLLDDELARREAWAALRSFLEGLEEGRREAFVLGELEGLGRRELGDALGVNANTAYSRLQSARRTFATHFAAYDDASLVSLITAGNATSPADARAWTRVWGGLVVAVDLPVAVTLPKLVAAWAVAGAALLGTTVALVPASDPVPVFVPPAASHGEAIAVDVVPAHGSGAIYAAPTPPENPPSPGEPATVATPRRSPALRNPPVLDEVGRMDARTIDAEVQLLVAARNALAHGSTTGARRLLDEYGRRFGAAGELDRLRRDLEDELTTSIQPHQGGD